jgi:hypothetical protein
MKNGFTYRGGGGGRFDSQYPSKYVILQTAVLNCGCCCGWCNCGYCDAHCNCCGMKWFKYFISKSIMFIFQPINEYFEVSKKKKILCSVPFQTTATLLYDKRKGNLFYFIFNFWVLVTNLCFKTQVKNPKIKIWTLKTNLYVLWIQFSSKRNSSAQN